CGTGLLLFRLAPEAASYLGTDFSGTALDGIRRRLLRPLRPLRPEPELPQVALRQAAADDWRGIDPGTADLVIVNSVVQYFPGVDYLVRVLGGAVAAVRPGGAVFVGDVRSRPLAAAFALSVELFQAPEERDLAELSRRRRRRVADEEELVLDPGFFLALARQLPAIARVDLRLKRGRCANELTRFRYDVVLHVGEAGRSDGELPRVDGSGFSLADIERLLSGNPAALSLAGLANARLAAEAAALELLAEWEEASGTAGELRRAVAARAAGGSSGVDPEALAELAERLGYAVELTVDPAAPFRFGARFWKAPLLASPLTQPAPSQGGGTRLPGSSEVPPDLPLYSFANDPLAGKLARRLVPELRRFLAAELPEYMVPGAFVLLPELPVTAHGKVDRTALPAPEPAAARSVGAAPRTPAEERLAELWREVLGLEEVAAVGREDNFFALGGHSLLATQLVSRVRTALGVDLPLRMVFERPVLADLAAALAALATQAGSRQIPTLAPARSAARTLETPGGRLVAPLSFAQERLWFIDRLTGTTAYNLSLALSLEGDLSPAALEAALAAIVRRHGSLRTTFALAGEGSQTGDAPVQVVAPSAPWRLPRVDLAALPAPAGALEVHRLARESARRPFDLARGPLLRAALLQQSPGEHTLFLALHHIVSDGWSMGILVAEVVPLYQAALARHPSPLPELPIQYTDFAVWQRRWLAGAVLDEQLGYWRERLAGLPAELALPADRPRPARPSHRGDRLVFRVEPGPARGLKALAAEAEATPFMGLLAVFQALLARHSGADEVAVGSPIANRTQSEVEGLIGFFVNTLVLRADLTAVPSFRGLLGQVRETTLGAYAHQDLPFERLVAELKPERHLAVAPLVQVLCALQNAPVGRVDLPGVRLSSLAVETWTVQFDLEWNAFERDEGLDVLVSYSVERFDRTTVRRLAGHFATLLAAAVADPGRRLADLPLLAPGERQQLAVEWNDTARTPEVLAVPGVVERFTRQVARTPEAVAFEGGGAGAAGGEWLTYGELDRRAGRLAARLRREGVGRDVPVGLFAERGPELVVGLFALWRAGGVYLPLDPGLPPARLAYLLEDSEVPVLLAPGHLAAVLPSPAAGTVRVVRLDEPAGEEREGLPAAAPAPSDLACRIYTSGTTGRPKAVLVEHGNLASTLDAVIGAFGFGPGDRLPAIASFSFDIFLFELLGPLLTGGTVALLPLRPTLDFERLWDELQTATLFHAVPAAMRQLVELARLRAGDRRPAPALRALFTGGDVVPADLLADLRALFPQAEIAVLYGPTEATIVCTAWPVPGDSGDPGRHPVRPLLGRPLPGVAIELRDRSGQPVPVGVAGEIWIGGAGVTRGYWRRPELQAERFVEVSGRRWFRSGDFARRLADGTLEFLGRADEQVKVRGFRIEPGEIEAQLLRHPRVRAAVAAVRDLPEGRGRQLVAYVVLRPEVQAEEAKPAGAVPELRSFLAAELPDYMIPAAFVLLPELPVTVHGKVDRAALPAPEPAAQSGGSAPRTPAESRLAELWREVLGLAAVATVAREDHFFERGGHSLLATQLVSRVKSALGLDLPLPLVFERPVLADLAAALDGLAAAAGREIPEIPAMAPAPRVPGAPAVERPARRIAAPLSFAQERLWFIDRLTGTSAYNLPLALSLEGDLSPAALEAALAEIVRRHGSLRTTFVLAGEGDTPVQIVALPAPWRLPRVDLAVLPAPRRDAEVRRLAGENARRPFDLGRGPLLRAVLLRLGTPEDSRHILLLTLHHIVSDGWSMGILVAEVVPLYRAALTHRPSPLPELPTQYTDFARWQRQWLAGAVLEEQLAYWRERLADIPAELELPLDHPRPAERSYRGDRLPFRIEAGPARLLKSLIQKAEATPFMGLLAVFQALLARITGADDVAVGAPIANRTRREVEGLVGFFVNTLVLRTDLAGVPSFRALLARVREVTVGAFAHQDLPFERLVEELGPERSLARNPLFQVMFALENTPMGSLDLPGLRLAAVEGELPFAQFDLTLTLRELPGGSAGLVGDLEYSSDLFHRTTVARLVGHFQTLLAAAVAAPDRPLAELPLLSAPERAQLLTEWNDTRRDDLPDFPLHPLHRLIAARAALDPDAPAVLAASGESLSYGELVARAGRLARRLAEQGVGPESRVAIAAGRSPDLVVGMLAVLAAGGAYVPLDPDAPAERIALIRRASGATLLLTAERLRAPDGLAVDLPVDPLPPAAVDPATAAYVLYTSGSTGVPKGVVVSHRSLARYARSAAELYRLRPGDRLLQFSSLGFDTSVDEIWCPLVAGATVVLRSDEMSGAIPRFLGEVLRLGVTVLSLPTAFWHELALGLGEGAALPAAIRLAIIGGEAAQPQSLTSWRFGLRRAGPAGGEVVLLNAYGPTEATISTTFADLKAVEEGAPVPLGRALDGVRLQVVDRDLQPVPAGVWGELLIGGVGVARGYLDRPDTTAESFLPDAWGDEPGGRVYKSGDRVRLRPDGELHWGGRMDHQVKVRGFRVEPGEVEAVLAAHPGLSAAAVVARRSGDGDALLACVVPVEGREAPAVAELRAFLAARLPAYMVPGAFAVLAALPLTPNGKIDRRTLARQRVGAGGEPPTSLTPLEARLARLWEEVLGISGVGREDSFFALGGHSLAATRLVARLSAALGVEVPLPVVFEEPTLAGMAGRLSRLLILAAAPGSAANAAVGRAADLPLAAWRGKGGAVAPLSFAQERLWFVDRLRPGNTAFNMPAPLLVRGTLDLPALDRACRAVRDRQGSLRTRFVEKAGAPVQVVDPPGTGSLPRVDLDGLPARLARGEARRLAATDAARPFDLARGPLFRPLVARLGLTEHLLLLTCHHVISDGWSTDVLIRELVTGYLFFAAGAPGRPPLPDLPLQYADFAVWQRDRLSGPALDAEIGYWRGRLAGTAPLDLPTDRPRRPVPTLRGGARPFQLGAVAAKKLAAIARGQGATLFMALHAGFSALLARFTGRSDLPIGTPVANRTWEELEGLIGFFVNTLVLRVDLAGDPDLPALLARSRDTALGAFAHQDLPFEKLVDELDLPRDPYRPPLLRVLLQLENVREEAVDLPGLALAPFGFALEMAKFDLTVNLTELPGGVGGELRYDADLFDPTTIDRTSRHFTTLLATWVADPARPLSALSLLSAAERHQLLVEWNEFTFPGSAGVSPALVSRETLLHRRFEAQVDRAPDAVAVVAEGERLTYGELDRQANRLARHLRSAGVRPGDRVALSLERSAGMVAAILGVLKAGAAYVPLDPAHPAERIAFAREDSGAALLVTETDLEAARRESAQRFAVPVDPSFPAYVIYTSGSTGKPKGVVVSHANVDRLFTATDRWFGFGPGDTWTLFHSYAFDFSVWEIWGALLHGGRLVVVPYWESRSPEGFYRLLQAERVTVLNQTPSAFRQLLWAEEAALNGATPDLALSWVIFGGEALEPASLAPWFERHGETSPTLVNMYGITETTVHVTFRPLRAADLRRGSVLGRPIPDLSLHVVDPDLRPQPIGVPGELHVGGAGLAQGYLGRPELTAERFVPDPFAG
ncbi:MAG TPA: amino acid adenylation domain-containing protein, partial [Thermoanaerobaculia bacterium]|nr:amino acid adenylation domain-containing protein [Thermoanaerobaculia bacterium]